MVFSTYTCLVSGTGKKSSKSRLDQLVEWCNANGDFEGVIVFDECHKAKNVNLNKVEKSSKTAQASTTLRVVVSLPLSF